MADQTASKREEIIKKTEDLVFTLAQRAEQKNVAEAISYASDIKKLVIGLLDLTENRENSSL